jgi:hypothetical protein
MHWEMNQFMKRLEVFEFGFTDGLRFAVSVPTSLPECDAPPSPVLLVTRKSDVFFARDGDYFTSFTTSPTLLLERFREIGCTIFEDVQETYVRSGRRLFCPSMWLHHTVGATSTSSLLGLNS